MSILLCFGLMFLLEKTLVLLPPYTILSSSFSFVHFVRALLLIAVVSVVSVVVLVLPNAICLH